MENFAFCAVYTATRERLQLYHGIILETLNCDYGIHKPLAQLR